MFNGHWILRSQNVLVLAFVLGIFVTPVLAQNTSLSWTAPTTDQGGGILTGLSGYRVHYGTSAHTYSTSIDVGNVTSYNLSLPAGTYFFAVTAHDPSGNQSQYSNEVSKTVLTNSGSPTPISTPKSTSNSDVDSDGVKDSNDNCPLVANSDQADANANGKGDLCERARANSCSVSEQGLSLLAVRSGNNVHLLDAQNDADLATTPVLKRQQVVIGDIDGAASEFSGFGNLDVTSVDSKMIWSTSSISGLKKKHFGKNGKAMLCNIDGDALLDYAVFQNNVFKAKRSSDNKSLSVSLRSFGEIKDVRCADAGQGIETDQLIITHLANKKTKNNSKQARSSARKSAKGLKISIVDLKSKRVIEQRSTSLNNFAALAIADTDGDGVVETCLLQGGKSKSAVTCVDPNGESRIDLPFKAKQLASGNFLEDQQESREELAITSLDGRVYLIANGSISHELILAVASLANTNPNVKLTLTQCR